jgi:hypothetical protein
MKNYHHGSVQWAIKWRDPVHSIANGRIIIMCRSNGHKTALVFLEASYTSPLKIDIIFKIIIKYVKDYY